MLASQDNETAYKSTSQAVIAYYNQKNDEFREHHERAFAQLEEWGLKEARGFASMGGVLASRDQIVGVFPIEGQDPPAGWRLSKDARGPVWVPKLNTKIGKKLDAELKEIQPPLKLMANLPGMPDVSWKGNHVYAPAMFVFEQAMYLKWTVPPEDEEVDDLIWQRIKLSEWYVAKEQHDEQKDGQTDG